jgi:hypothetical protein
MRRRGRSLCLGLLLVVGLLLAAVPAQAGHDTDPHTKNLRPMGHTDDNRPIRTFLEPFFTDIAFWGKVAYQGTWFGGSGPSTSPPQPGPGSWPRSTAAPSRATSGSGASWCSARSTHRSQPPHQQRPATPRWPSRGSKASRSFGPLTRPRQRSRPDHRRRNRLWLPHPHGRARPQAPPGADLCRQRRHRAHLWP